MKINAWIENVNSDGSHVVVIRCDDRDIEEKILITDSDLDNAVLREIEKFTDRYSPKEKMNGAHPRP